MLHDIANKTRVNCGLAAIIDLVRLLVLFLCRDPHTDRYFETTGLLEDKQPSFVTSETLKYLYLTFDEDNPFNHDDSNAVYSTEGHMLEVDTRPIPGRRRRSIPAEAPSCPAYDPMFLPETQHILLQSVGTRTDFEWARHLAGYVVKDEADEIASGRWSESGFCEIPVSEVSPCSPLPPYDAIKTDREKKLVRTTPSRSSLLLQEMLKLLIPRAIKSVPPRTMESSSR